MVKYILDYYILQEENKCDEKISTSGEIVIRDKYLGCMK